MISYKFFFFKTGNPITDNFIFLKRFGALCNSLIDLLSKEMSTLEAAEEQNVMINKIEEQKKFILLEEKSIDEEKAKGAIKKVKTKTQRKEILASQKSILKDAIRLYDKRTFIINALINKDIYSGDVEKDMHYIFKESEPQVIW